MFIHLLKFRVRRITHAGFWLVMGIRTMILVGAYDFFCVTEKFLSRTFRVSRREWKG